MEPVLAYAAQQVPRFGRDDPAARLAEALLRQRTLWATLVDLLHAAPPDAEGQVSAELRFTSEPEGGQVGLALRVYADASSANGELKQRLRCVEHVLPMEYLWRKVDPRAPAFRHNLSPRWHVSRVERRLEFLDLPWRSLDTVDRSSAARLGTGGQRQLLTRAVVPTELQHERFCIPLSPVLAAERSPARTVFQVLQNEAPCIVSCVVSRMHRSRLDTYRQLSAFWSHFVDPIDRSISRAGLTPDGHLRALFDRFLLPERQLLCLTLRIAAVTPEASAAVAMHWAARFGGLNAFALRPPQKPITDGGPSSKEVLDGLADPRIDVPSNTWSEAKLAQRRERVRDELERAGISPHVEPAFLDYLLDLPHLYTQEEIGMVASLPVADDEGLPGLESRPVAPFSSVVTRRGPSADVALPRDRLRVGVLPPRSGAAAGREWHTLSPSDLTKHAFIVGSTGSGKTVMTTFLLRELLRLDVPFLVIEPVKTEYHAHLAGCRPRPSESGASGPAVRRVRFEGTAQGRAAEDFLAFDPMRLQEGVTVARHASYLKSCFTAAFPMPEDSVEAMLLETGLRSYYVEPRERMGCGLTVFSRGGAEAHHRALVMTVERRFPADPVTGRVPPPQRLHRLAAQGCDEAAGEHALWYEEVVHPSLDGLRKFFARTFLPSMVSARGGQKLEELLETWRQFFERRFDALASGMVGIAARKADALYLADRSRHDTFGELLAQPTILELDGIPDDEQKALMLGFVMAFLFERRQADDLLRREAQAEGRAIEPPGREALGGLRHVLVVEEAHRILAQAPRGGEAGRKAHSVSLFVDMLAEIRAFGQGIVIVEQIPTKIVPEAVKNTNLKVMLRLTAADDRDCLGDAMNFTDEQKRFVTSLQARPGHGVEMVVFEQQLDQPRLLTLPLPSIPERPIHRSLFTTAEGDPA